MSDPESDPYPPLTHLRIDRGLRTGRRRGGGLRDAEEAVEQKRSTFSRSLKRTDLSLPRLLPGGLARSSAAGFGVGSTSGSQVEWIALLGEMAGA